MIAGRARGKAKAKAKAREKERSECLLSFPRVCRRLLAGCQFVLIIILAVASGQWPMASVIVACTFVASKGVSSGTTFTQLAQSARRSDYVLRLMLRPQMTRTPSRWVKFLWTRLLKAVLLKIHQVPLTP